MGILVTGQVANDYAYSGPRFEHTVAQRDLPILWDIVLETTAQVDPKS